MQILETSLHGINDNQSFDVVVIGAGAGGLAASLFAALKGFKVLLVEHTDKVGGTTAISAGTAWIPLTRHSTSVNPDDSLEAAMSYLDAACGVRSDRNIREAFLRAGHPAVEALETHTDVQLRAYPKHPDYISDLPGSTLNGRALEALPFDGRKLGGLFRLLREPIPEFTVLGGMMVDRTDINHLLGLTKSWASFKYSLKILARHASDRLHFPRGTRLVMGNALVGRLLYSLSKHPNVTLAMNTSVVSQSPSLTLSMRSETKLVNAVRGVVLAGGGFNRNPELRKALLNDFPQAWCPGAPGHTASTQAMAIERGAKRAGTQLSTSAFWAPVSLRTRSDGTTAAFPHFVMDRAKPGTVVVNQEGQRFVNESTSYHLFGLAMQQTQSVPAYLICDHRALQAYGLGMVRPGANANALNAAQADGYLTRAPSINALAEKLRIPPLALASSVAQINEAAKTGVDLAFGRGTTAYSQNIGDAQWPGKNPNLGVLDQAPFYAVKLFPGDIGSCAGLKGNEHAQVLDSANQAIEGLYAVGNDLQSVMGDAYTAPGITIGPAIVFAWLAVNHMASSARNAAKVETTDDPSP